LFISLFFEPLSASLVATLSKLPAASTDGTGAEPITSVAESQQGSQAQAENLQLSISLGCLAGFIYPQVSVADITGLVFS
jgi:hypothetical protein